MEVVSVIVPIYKVEQYLNRCVESIINQTYPYLEIILVDDGSPDRCGEICEEFSRKDNRIRVLHKKNGGLSDARNAGLEIATGKYILFVDSDDYIKKDLIEKCICEAEKNQSDMVIFDFLRVEETGEELCSMELDKSGTYTLQEEPRLLFGATSAWNKLFRRDLFIKTEIRFPVGKYYEDLGTIPKLLLLANKITYLKEPFYYYIIRPGSIMTAAKFEKNYADRTEMIDGILDFYIENKMYQTYYKELEYFVMLNGYFFPSREIILQDRKSFVIKKFKKYIGMKFPGYKKNIYLKQYLLRKDKLHFYIIESEQYWIMVLLSECKKKLSRKLHKKQID